jgi:hypothetical protein
LAQWQWRLWPILHVVVCLFHSAVVFGCCSSSVVSGLFVSAILFGFHLAQLIVMVLVAAHFRLLLPLLSIIWWWLKLQQSGDATTIMIY